VDIVLTLALAAGIFWVAEALWRHAPSVPDDGGGAAIVDSGLFSAAFIRRRLDALTAELDRLDHDPDVFAKAFHTTVARSAYQELLAEASRLVDQPRGNPGQTLDADVVGPARNTREVLEL
jgi:hypothetical protein